MAKVSRRWREGIRGSYCETQQTEIELTPNCLFYRSFRHLQGGTVRGYPVHDFEGSQKNPWRFGVRKNPALAGTVLGLPSDSDLA